MDFSSTEERTLSEKEIIRRVIAGERDEFRLLVQQYQAVVFSVIVRQVNSESVARELTQDAFLKAYLSLAKFRFEASFATWLIRIALNLTNSYFSSADFKRRLKTVRLDMEAYKQRAEESNSDCYDGEAIKRLEVVVGMLKPKLREVFILCGFEQKSYQKAANILQIPIGTVRSRLNRARLVLQQIYFEAE